MSKLSDTIADLRKSYEQAELDENQSSDRPLRQFEPVSYTHLRAHET